jgi:hypothetical protein
LHFPISKYESRSCRHWYSSWACFACIKIVFLYLLIYTLFNKKSINYIYVFILIINTSLKQDAWCSLHLSDLKNKLFKGHSFELFTFSFNYKKLKFNPSSCGFETKQGYMNPVGYKIKVLFSTISGIEHKEVKNHPYLVVMSNNYRELDSNRVHVFRYKDGIHILKLQTLLLHISVLVFFKLCLWKQIHSILLIHISILRHL